MGHHSHRFVEPTFARRPGDETLAQIAAFADDDAYDDWREAMAEIAAHNRSYAEGDWSLNDWLEWSPVGRGEAAEHARSLDSYIPAVSL